MHTSIKYIYFENIKRYNVGEGICKVLEQRKGTWHCWFICTKWDWTDAITYQTNKLWAVKGKNNAYSDDIAGNPGVDKKNQN